MREVNETTVDALPEILKTFVIQNTSRHEKVIVCYLIHVSGLFGDSWAVVALTNQRLLCRGKGELFFVVRREPWALGIDNWVNDKRTSEQFNVNLLQIVQVPRRESGAKYVNIELGSRDLRLAIELGNKEQADKFHGILAKAIAEATFFPPMSEMPHHSSDIADQLAKLVELRKNGAISEEEFQAGKRKLLS